MPPSATSSRPAFDPAPLRAAVQRNCDLADARHADGRSLCTYLLGMRELFRWESGLPLGTPPQRAAVAGWIAERERYWDALCDDSGGFAPLPLGDRIEAFDEAEVNRRLEGHALVYGAGFGLFGAPLFFLAERRSISRRDGATVIVAGQELARGIHAPPAVSRSGTIVIRLDALRRWLWTRAEVARRGPGDAFTASLASYGDPADPATIDKMAEGESESLLLHELGELRVGAMLEPDWSAMLAGIADRRTELVLRAVRDLLADCLVTLTALTARRADGSLLFWRSNFDGLRRQLAPQLAAPLERDAARLDHAGLAAAAQAGQLQWRQVALELLSAWRRDGEPAVREQAEALATGA